MPQLANKLTPKKNASTSPLSIISLLHLFGCAGNQTRLEPFVDPPANGGDTRVGVGPWLPKSGALRLRHFENGKGGNHEL